MASLPLARGDNTVMDHYHNFPDAAMTEDIVTGTQPIRANYNLPHIPMVHCFLVYQDFRVDLTEDNQNEKKGYLILEFDSAALKRGRLIRNAEP